MIVPEPRNVGAKGAQRPDGSNRLEFVTFCVVLRVMEMRGNKPASVARRAGLFPEKVAMVKDERSLRTRQRPVRSGALRGAKSEIFYTRPPLRRCQHMAPDRQPVRFHRLFAY